MSVSASLPLAPAAPVIAIPSDQTSAPRAALHPTANSNITVPTLSESEESEIETGAPYSIPEQAHVYSYAQACTYPLFFGLDSPARLGRTHSIICNPQARRRKMCHPVGINKTQNGSGSPPPFWDSPLPHHLWSPHQYWHPTNSPKLSDCRPPLWYHKCSRKDRPSRYRYLRK